jgi:hypothetical protein
MTVSPFDTQPDYTREIIAKCKRETRIRYQSKGDTFFRPRLRGINYLQVGKSKIVDNPFTILVEWIYDEVIWLRAALQRFSAWLFPRRRRLPDGHRDSRLVGRIIFAGDRGSGPPIHNLHLEFWGRTLWFAWRKIGEACTPARGSTPPR